MPRLTEEELRELVAITPEEIEKLSYESSMELLEQVVSALEQEGTPLDCGVKLYELGTTLSKKCGAILDATEEKMFQLLGDAENAREVPFDPEKDGR
ncbi:MAG: exodeoxyribonuclease small subunit [Clostridiales bacterium]|jgi:exodeoxyribonuclease VII small subunit|nr:exodeoxyribonuclease small subunit [Clostridiales bacterium]MDN5282676.1 exodeoxyribonuclease small subunit [Candidatus Ozemobacter sp.]